MLGVLLYDVAADGFGKLSWDFLTSFPSAFPDKAGIESPLMGTLWLMFVCASFIIPVGVATAIYLEEYANRDRWWNRFIEVNIQNLAAVPSIVYGILGLAFLVRGPLELGRVVLAGGLTLGLLVLPVVIIASREAIRAVPPSIREGSMALGATQWQTIRKQVLPGRDTRHRDRRDPRALARHRRDRAADPRRRRQLRGLQPRGPRLRIHRAAAPDLRVDLAPAGRVQATRSRRHPRPARAAA